MPGLHSGCGAALPSLHTGCRKGAGTEMCLKALAMSTPTLKGTNTCQGQDTTTSTSQQNPNWAMEVGDALVLPVWLHQGWVGGRGPCCGRELWSVLLGNHIRELEPQLCMEGAV